METTREPLYDAVVHSLGRGMGYVAASFMGIGALAGITQSFEVRSPLPLLISLGFGCLSYLAARTPLRARRVFGSAQGITINDAESSEVIPWNRVGNVECPPSSFNPILRTYYVTLLDRSERLYFFARQRELRRWEELRASARPSAQEHVRR